MERNIREVGDHKREYQKMEKEKEKKETLQTIRSGNDKLSEEKRPPWSGREEIATIGLEKMEVESLEPAQEVPRKCRVPVTFTAIKKSGSKVNNKNFLVQKIQAMIDSGQNIREGILISKQLCKKLGLLESLEKMGKETSIGTAAKGTGLKIVGKVKKGDLIFSFNGGPKIQIEPLVAEGITHHANIGVGALRQMQGELNFTEGKLNIFGKFNISLETLGKAEKENSNVDAITEIRNDRACIIEPMQTVTAFGKIPQTWGKVEKVWVKTNHVGAQWTQRQIKPWGTQDQKGVVIMWRNNGAEPIGVRKGFRLMWISKEKPEEKIAPEKISSETTKLITDSEEIQEIADNEIKTESDKKKDKRVEELFKALKLDENVRLKKKPALLKKVKELVRSYEDIFVAEGQTVGRVPDKYTFEVKLKPGAVPVKQKVRPLHPLQMESLRKQLDEWLEEGVIRPSNSPWSSPLVPVPKKGTDRYRWCIDFRRLNQQTVGDSYPAPVLEDIIRRIGDDCCVFSTLDCSQAYLSVPIAEESKQCTAFGTPFGLFEFNRSPYGMLNAGAKFNQVSGDVGDEVGEPLLVYVDDNFLKSLADEEHLVHLELTFKTYRKYGLKVNPNKTRLFQDEVEFLGLKINADGVKPTEEGTEKIKNWPTPARPKDVASFLGLIQWYSQFMPKFSELSFRL
ncbi:MAG: reverse transcriptase family protein, partial [Nitrospinota bacterium]|nr:reverse transcriptase family protein [Nitrospinota bacterium]